MSTEQQKRPDGRDATSTNKPRVVTLPEDEDRETLVHYYHQMLHIRRFEEKAGEMYNRARIGGYCHLNLGEEATVVGFCAGLEPKDYVYTNYREHGYAIGRGIPSSVVMAELFGKETGCSHGRGGSMHMFDKERRFMGGYGIVGGQAPLATGAAFAISYRGGDEIVVCQMGDGATNGGPFYESLNLAKIYNLPIVFFIVNNGYGMGLPAEKGSAMAELYRKAYAFNMYGERVDGNDVLAVRDAMRRAAKKAREEHEPVLLEAVSYRFRGHSVVDPDRYRDEEMVKSFRSKDPIAAFATRLLDAKLINKQGLQAIEEQVEREIEEAVRFAEESPFPAVETLFDHIYATEDSVQESR
ncbi:pyruvate dehydrogenase (acetyl-transferring) E1 component subunit alpha [Tengunoibacter tsumagoiensis]|uniref:Pyruvate dehydrogenase E1 component subunit alpha n=1 Tax=Tengunoibacter tsumagoiensis TaxID=2014871 RepID=A0A402A3B9_9CHLR|nr:pyruvate dehydrogenase (acetyl-transferring) E1 component subunit alpha [Tengunoibacter tsumagoiensis]GCE13658.1 pyruvate dehydrogenase E1 component subunit alpha [Tengunoibacter tsumagoiensis]